MMRRTVLFALILGIGCGTQSSSGSDAILADAPGADGEVAGEGLVVKILASPTKGNAPLTVHFESEVSGCDQGDVSYLWTLAQGTTSTKKDPGDFVFNAPGAYNVRLEVTCDATGKSASDVVQVVVLASAELSVSPPHLNSPTTVAPGDTLLLSFDVVNRGDRVDIPFLVHIVLSRNELYEPGSDVVLKEVTIQGMADGRFGEVRQSFTNEPAALPPDLADGAYFIFVAVDPTNVVSEGREDDNVGQATSFITVEHTAKEKPDLTVTPPSFAQGTKVAAGKAFAYSITIDNVGSKAASNFKYAVFASLDASLSADDVPLSDQNASTIYKLEPGKPVTISGLLVVPANLPTGPYYAIAQVDTNDTVAEEDETNNVAVSPFVFDVTQNVVTGFDIAVESVAVQPHDTYWGGTIKATVKVTNVGNKASPKFPIAFFVSSEPSVNTKYDPRLSNLTADSLDPGQTADVVAVVPIPSGPSVKPGDYYVSAVVDPDSTLDELAKNNNWKYDPKPIHVYQEAFVDVGVEGAVAHPTTVEAGEEIKVSYNLTNKGSTAAGAFVNYIVLSPDKTVSLADISAKKDFVVGKVTVDGVDPAAKVERIEKVMVPLALPHEQSEYYVGVIVDALGNLAADKNKANQTAVTADPITVLGAKGGCYEDAMEPNGSGQTAWAIQPGVYEKLGLCSGEDWYKVHVEAGQSIQVRMVAASPLFLEPRPTELDLELRDPHEKVLDASTANGPEDRVVALAVPESGDYLIRVFPRIAGNQAQYTLTVEVQPPEKGVDLTVTHVQVIPDAIFPGGLLNVTARVVNLGLDASPATLARILLSTEGVPKQGDSVLGEAAVAMVPGTGFVDLKVPVLLPKDTAGGQYYVILVLDPDQEVVEANEDNNFAASGILDVDETMVCEDDQFDPNEAPEVATVLDPEGGTYQNLNVCPDLPDVYAVDLPVGVSLTVSVTYDHKLSKGYLAVDVIDPTMTAVLDSAPQSTAPVVGIPCVFMKGRYYVRVRVNPSGGKAGPYSYSMALTIEAPLAGEVCTGDRAEPNNDFLSAATLGCGSNQFTLCKKDKDYYRLPVLKGTTLVLGLSQGKAELKMSLYQDTKAPPIKTVSGNANLDWVAPEDMTVYVVVEPKGTMLTEYKYQLSVDGIPGMDLVPANLTLTPDEVWQGEDCLLSFKLTNACQDAVGAFDYEAFLSTNLGLDALDVPLLTGTVSSGVKGKSSVDTKVKAMVPLDTAPGKYYVLVVADPDNKVAESQEDNNVAGALLTVSAVCVNDPLEPNNEPNLATLLSPGIYQDLVVCPYDNDWYRVHVEAGHTITVVMSAKFADGDLDLRLYDSSDLSKPVAMSATQEDVESLSYKVPPASGGDYLVRVSGFMGVSNTYSLTISVE